MRKKVIKLAAVVSVIIEQASVLMGEESDAITVIGDQVRIVEEIERKPAFVDVIDVSDSPTKFTTVSDILSSRVGVQVKRYGGIGSKSYISIRGVNSNQVMIYLDGVPLNDAKSGEQDLAEIPLDNIERIEIYRSHTPVEFETPGIGGIVNIVTKKKGKSRSTGLSVSYGSYNTSKVSLNHAQKTNSLYYSLFFNRTGSDGDFKYKDDNGTPVVNTADDYRTTRKNNDHYSYTVTGTLGFDLGEWTVSMMNDFFYKNQGLPGLSGNETEHVSFNTMRNNSNIRFATKDLLLRNSESSIHFYYSLKNNCYDDPEQELGLTDGVEEQKGLFDSLGMNLLNEFFFDNYFHTIKTRFSFNRVTYLKSEQLSDNSERDYPEMKRYHLSAGLEDEWYLLEGKLQIVPQLRYSFYRDLFYDEHVYTISGERERSFSTDHLWSWQLGSRYYLYREVLYIKGNIGTSYRQPNFTELFGDCAYVMSNTDLTSEKAFNRDIGFGLLYKPGRRLQEKKGDDSNEQNTAGITMLRFEYSFFYNTIEDMIIFIYNIDTMKAFNISGALIYGHELTLTADLLNHLEVSGNYTYQKAVDKSDIPYYRNNILPHRPVHEASGKIKVYSPTVAVSYEIAYTGYNFRDRANSRFYYIDSRIIHNAMLQLYPVDDLILSFEVKNISNNDVRDVIGAPLPGRSYYGTVSYSF